MATQANVALRFVMSGQNSVIGIMDRISGKKRDLEQPVDVPITANDTEAQIRFDRVKKELDDLNKRVAKSRLTADSAEGLAKVAEFKIELRKLNEYVSRPTISDRGIDRTELRLLKLLATLKKIDNTHATFSVRGLISRIPGLGGGGRGGDSIESLLGGGGGAGGSSGGSNLFSNPLLALANPVSSGTLTNPAVLAALAGSAPFIGTVLGGAGTGFLGAGLAGLGIAGAVSGSQKSAQTPANAAALTAAEDKLRAAQDRRAAAQDRLNKLENSGKATAAQLASAQAGLASAQGSVVTAQQKYNQLQDDATSGSPKLANALKELGDNAVSGWQKISVPFQGALLKIVNAGEQVLPKVLKPLGAAFQAMAGPVGALGVAIANSFGSPAVGTAIKTIASAFNQFLAAFTPQIPGIANALAQGIIGMASAFTDHPDMIKGMVAIVTFLLKLPGYVAGALGSLTRVSHWLVFGLPHDISIGLDAARGAFINAGHTIESTWDGLWGNVKGVTSTSSSSVLGAISKYWGNIAGFFERGYNSVVGVYNRIKNFVTGSFDKWWAVNGDAIKSIWQTVWGFVKSVIDAYWPPIIGVVKVGWVAIDTLFKIGANAVVAAWRILWATAVGAVRVLWAEAQGVIKVGWAVISLLFKSSIGILVASWRIFWSVIENTAKVVWTVTKNSIKGIWDIIVGLFGIFINLITGRWGAALTDMKNMGTQIWNLTKNNLNAIWNAIKNIGIAIWNALRAYLIGLWNNTRTAAISSWNAIRSAVVSIWQSVVSTGKSIWSDFFGWLRSGWHAVVNSASTIWGGIKNAVLSPVRWVVNNVWDPFANIIDTATKFLHMGSPLPVVHMATGGIVPQLVPGSGDKQPALLEAGETVVDKGRSKLLSHIFGMVGVPGYATGGVVGGGPPSVTGRFGPIPGGPSVGDIVNVGKTVVGFGAHLIQGAVLGVVKPAVDKLLGLLGHMPGANSGFGHMITQLPKSIADGLFNLIAGKDKAFNASAAHVPNVGSGVARWAGLVAQALSMLHLPGNLAKQVLYQMQTESGGNPNAQNNWDINAQHGDPSRGLLQVIGSTFRTYHVAGTSGNIFDPLANIAAAINYALHVYGPSLMRGGMGMGSGHGYADGTPGARRGWAWVGERGRELVHFNGGEQVIANHQLGMMGYASGTNPRLVAAEIEKLRATIAKYEFDERHAKSRLQRNIYAADVKVDLAKIYALEHPHHAAAHHAAHHAASNKAEISTGIALMLAYGHGDTMSVKKLQSEQTTYLKAISRYYNGHSVAWRDAQVERQTKAMEAAQNRLTAIQKNFNTAKSYASSVTSNLAGYADLQNIDLSGGGGIVGGLSAKVSSLKQFASLLTKLRQRGVSKAIIQQIIGMGPDTGMQYAQALATATAGTIHAVNTSESQIAGLTSNVGRQAALAVYGIDIAKGIASQEKPLKALMNRLGKSLGQEAAAWFHVPAGKRPRGYAIGTRNASRGWAIIGENGPELMFFHGGESVIPSGSGLGRGTTGTIIIENLNVNFRGQPLHTKAEIGRTVKEAIAYTERRGN